MLSACRFGSTSIDNPDIIVLKETKRYQNDGTPCVVQVPCHEPELRLLFEKRAIERPYKYYNFCDSSVSIVAAGAGDKENAYGAIYDRRSFDEIRGNEYLEFLQARDAYEARRQSDAEYRILNRRKQAYNGDLSHP